MRPCPQGFPDIWWFIWDELPVGVSAAENMRFPGARGQPAKRDPTHLPATAAPTLLVLTPTNSLHHPISSPLARRSYGRHHALPADHLRGQRGARERTVRGRQDTQDCPERGVPEGGHLPGGQHLQREADRRVQARGVPAGASRCCVFALFCALSPLRRRLAAPLHCFSAIRSVSSPADRTAPRCAGSSFVVRATLLASALLSH